MALSVKTLVWLLVKWKYALLAIVGAIVFFELVYWLFNYQLIGLIFGNSSISIGKKIEVFLSPLLMTSGDNGAISIIEIWIIALLQGVNVALLTYALRHQKKIDAGAIGGGSFVGLLAIIGLGCPSCGTSLITPMVAMFASSSAVTISESIVSIALPLAILIGLYSVYSLGIKAANVRAADDKSL